MSNALSHNKVSGTRLDKFLAKIAGKDVGEIAPKTELERQLNDIAESGGGGGMYIMDPKLLVGGETEGDAIVYADFDNLVKAIRNNQPVAFGGDDPWEYTLFLFADASRSASPPEDGDYVRLSFPRISKDGLDGISTITIYKNAPASGGGSGDK